MKTAISIPDPLFDNAERMAKRLGMSRSQFYGKAVDAFIKAQKGKGVKEALDAVYGSEASEVDPVLAKMQRRSLKREDW